MGCATSSPLVTVNDGFLKAAKGAADNVAHAGEETVHEMTGAMNTAVGSVKEAVVGAVQNVGQGIEQAFHGKPDTDISQMEAVTKTVKSEAEQGFKIIPLKDPNINIDQALDDIADTIDDKAKEYQDEAEKLANTTMAMATEKATEVLDNIADTSPVHSLDSLKTSTPESEIENALANNMSTSPPTPKPTFSELENLEKLKTEMNSNMPDVAQMPPEPKKELQKVLVDPTDWEKMADLLGRPQKINTVDALRRIMNRRYERRVASSSVRGRDAHRYDYNSIPYPIMQSPVLTKSFVPNGPPAGMMPPHSPCRSPVSVRARSPTNILRDPSPHRSVTGRVSQHVPQPIQRSPPKHANLNALNNSAFSVSPLKSPYRGRDRCVVCSGKYNSDTNSISSNSSKKIK